jgi:4-amino-4-deoxy-L-arabinose transferase-like glycosyltransferase
MLGGMEEDPEVRDSLLAKLLGLDFGLPSNEDTVSCKLHQLLLLFYGFNNLVSFPCLGFVFCAIGDGAGVRGIRLSEKIWSFVVLWTVFLIFLVCFLAAFVDIFVRVVKMYAVRECDREGERHNF